MHQQSPAAEPQAPRFLTLVLGVLTAFGAASIDMYLPSLPAIGESLQASPASVQLTLATFMVGMGIGQLVYGPLSDRLGRRPPLLFGITLYICASLACAFAPSIEALIASRFLQALGAAAGPVIARAIVRDFYAGQDVARVLSLMMLVMGAVPILAPALGGSLLTVFGWRAVFVVLAAFGLAALALAVFKLPQTRRVESSSTLRENVGALIADPSFVTGTLVGGFGAAALFAYIGSISFVLMSIYRFTPHEFAVAFGLNAAGFIGAAQLNGVLLRRFTMERLRNTAALALALVSGTLALSVLSSGAQAHWVIFLLFSSLACIGLLLPNSTALALHNHAQRAGVASSVIGATHFALAGVVMMLLGALDDGSAGPMALVILACGIGAVGANGYATLRGL